MTRDEMKTGVLEIMERVLQKRFPPGADVHRETEGRWDSLRHIELIFALEEKFGIRFDEEEMPVLNSLSILTDRIGLRYAA